ncbi:MAG: T9SS type A sorting domain-containing protein [Bacteroidia bacterium]|nr:T9SS type A sorting domain-containing protein [Bacteroidia bacterium]
MKKILLLFLLFSSQHYSQAQQFSFQMNFVDAIGNKDSIVLGYDALATDSLDPFFGELNIISVPFNTGLDVRISDEYNRRTLFAAPGTYHTKKQIVKANCQSTTISTIDIVTDHWPVTATWNNNLFSDACSEGSLFTSVHPGGWWDTWSPSNLWRQDLYFENSATFTTNASEFGIYYYNNNSGDTIPVFWQVFADTTMLINSVRKVEEMQKVEIFPNPSHSKIDIRVPSRFGTVVRTEIFSSTGRLVMSTSDEGSIRLENFESGLYFILLTNLTGDHLSTRLIKI